MAASSSPPGGGPGSAPRESNRSKRDRQARLRTPTDRQVWSQLDDMQRDAYDAGRRNDPRPPPEAHDAVHQAYDAGVEDRSDDEHTAAMDRMRTGAKQATAPKTDSKTAPPMSLSIQDQGAEFILGLVAYCLVINYVQHGWPGVTGWLSAKFTNKVTLTPAPNYNAPSPGLGSTNQSIGAFDNPNPAPQTAPFLGGIPGTSTFNTTAPKP